MAMITREVASTSAVSLLVPSFFGLSQSHKSNRPSLSSPSLREQRSSLVFPLPLAATCVLRLASNQIATSTSDESERLSIEPAWDLYLLVPVIPVLNLPPPPVEPFSARS
jgi:hypothetical protein